MSKINIIITSLRGGGTEQVCVTIANNLSDKGFYVDLTTINLERSIFQNQLDKKINLNNLKKSKISKSVLNLIRYLKERKNETILVFNYEIGILLIFLRKVFKFKNKIIIRNNNTISMELSKGRTKNIIMKFLVKFLNLSDVIIAQSEGMKLDLIKNYKIEERKIVVINNPVSKKIVERKNIVDKDINSDRYILCVGRLVDQKGFSFAIDAFDKLCKIENTSDIKLRIIGTGPKKKELLELAIEKEISDKVEFKEFTEDIVDEYIKAELILSTSLYEGFPNVLVEAISLGKPVVAFNCKSGPSEIINNENGFLVEYLNIDDLVYKIKKTLNKKWDKDKIKISANRFKSEIIIKKYIDIINNS